MSVDPELRELYQEVIVDHGRRPRNFRRIAGATRSVEGYNPLCGDHVMLDLELEGERVKDVAFEGKGCAISMASASVMTEVVKGKTRAEAEALFERFHRLVTQGRGHELDGQELGKLAVFAGVSEFPARVKCAMLPWHTLRAALEGQTDTVSTE
jgi:nitrogen fixation NifU-like protein